MIYPAPSGVDATRIEAKDIIQDKRILIQNRAIDYLNLTYPGLVYDTARCRRDVGYILDALCYDILYTGTQATTRVAQSYFVNGVSQLGGEEVETAAAAV